ASTPAVRNRPKPPAPSGTPIAAYRAPARSRAASRMTRSTGSVRRSAPSASATSSSRRSAVDSGLVTPPFLQLPQRRQQLLGGPVEERVLLVAADLHQRQVGEPGLGERRDP